MDLPSCSLQWLISHKAKANKNRATPKKTVRQRSPIIYKIPSCETKIFSNSWP